MFFLFLPISPSVFGAFAACFGYPLDVRNMYTKKAAALWLVHKRGRIERNLHERKADPDGSMGKLSAFLDNSFRSCKTIQVKGKENDHAY
jgi:hypothetical protein